MPPGVGTNAPIIITYEDATKASTMLMLVKSPIPYITIRGTRYRHVSDNRLKIMVLIMAFLSLINIFPLS